MVLLVPLLVEEGVEVQKIMPFPELVLVLVVVVVQELLPVQLLFLQFQLLVEH